MGERICSLAQAVLLGVARAGQGDGIALHNELDPFGEQWLAGFLGLQHRGGSALVLDIGRQIALEQVDGDDAVVLAPVLLARFDRWRQFDLDDGGRHIRACRFGGVGGLAVARSEGKGSRKCGEGGTY